MKDSAVPRRELRQCRCLSCRRPRTVQLTASGRRRHCSRPPMPGPHLKKPNASKRARTMHQSVVKIFGDNFKVWEGWTLHHEVHDHKLLVCALDTQQGARDPALATTSRSFVPCTCPGPYATWLPRATFIAHLRFLRSSRGFLRRRAPTQPVEFHRGLAFSLGCSCVRGLEADSHVDQGMPLDLCCKGP